MVELYADAADVIALLKHLGHDPDRVFRVVIDRSSGEGEVRVEYAHPIGAPSRLFGGDRP